MSSSLIGQLRPSQVVTTFGPGSIVDLREDSVMILGLDFWPSAPDTYRVIHEPRLEASLRVKEFHIPTSGDDEPNIPCVTFPEYRSCASCERLALVFRNASDQTFICPNCRQEKTYPARLIMACVDGHIDDFPWSKWVHYGASCAKGNPELFLTSALKTAAIADLIVHCKSCKAKRSLAGSLQPLDKIQCTGRQPWLGDRILGCKEIPRGLQRGASNVYFSLPESSISIPPWSSRLQRDIDRYWATISTLLDRDPNQLRLILPTLFPDYDLDEVSKAIIRRQGVRAASDIREEEWLALRTIVPVAEDDFETSPEQVPDSMSAWIESLVRVTRLREVRSIRGFTRIDPPSPDSRSAAHLIDPSREHLHWRPAVEVYGEGIFFSLNRKGLETWERSNVAMKRVNDLYEVYKEWLLDRKWPVPTNLKPRKILLHSLSHGLIRQLALNSGYSSASIRERIYSSDSMGGILLYTSSEDSEGSLGGLVQNGRTTVFQNLLEDALRAAMQCSSDPLCLENDPKETRTLNGAACHVCSLVSETSCEMANRLLDRRLILPSDQSAESYFKDLRIQL